MKIGICFSIAIITSFTFAFAQSQTILVHNMVSGSIDSLTNIPIDPTLQEGRTAYHIGNVNSNIETLAQTPPDSNTFPSTHFTRKKATALDYNLNSFPIRTSMKIFYIENGTMKNLCSGSMVSNRHVLTAAHCYLDNNNTLLFDSLSVCPVYDNGAPNPTFGCNNVNQLYHIKNWSLNEEDFVVLELEEPIGASTGWLSIGFDETEAVFTDDIFYKFSYPNTPLQSFDTFPYNGDTLYYNYGNVELLQIWIGITQANAVSGESGSSIIHVKNNQAYTSYGVLTYSVDLNHCRFNNETFQLIKHIIQNDLVISYSTSDFTIFPNPVASHFQIKNLPESQTVTITIFDALGKLVYINLNYDCTLPIDISTLPNGSYYVKAKTGETFQVSKIIKH